MESVIAKAGILIEAVPYIRTYHGRTFVIKYGGNAMVNENLKQGVMQDIVLLKFLGINPIVIHGGGPEISQMLKRIGKQSQFVQGLRVTDAETMEIVQMVLVGKLNKEIVAQLNLLGGKAVGLSGQDANLLVAQKTQPTMPSNFQGEIPDIGFVGEVVQINSTILEQLIRENYITIFIEERAEQWKSRGWSKYDETAPVMSDAEIEVRTSLLHGRYSFDRRRNDHNGYDHFCCSVHCSDP